MLRIPELICKFSEHPSILLALDQRGHHSPPKNLCCSESVVNRFVTAYYLVEVLSEALVKEGLGREHFENLLKEGDQGVSGVLDFFDLRYPLLHQRLQHFGPLAIWELGDQQAH